MVETRWGGAAVCCLLVIAAIGDALGIVGDPLDDLLPLLAILLGIAWALAGSAKSVRLSELYLWLALPLSLDMLYDWADEAAGVFGTEHLATYEVFSGVHVLLIASALWRLGAWSRRDKASEARPRHPARLAAGLLIVGAVVFWIGASSFPGLAAEKIAANREAHLLTSATFLLAALLTLQGLALLTFALRKAGDSYLSGVGLVGFLFASLLWTIHLAFRLTVMVWEADGLQAGAEQAAWMVPWRDWAGLLFALYSVIAYLCLAAYSGALLAAGFVPRWAGRTCLAFAFVAAPFVGPPLLIHFVPWFLGIVLLRHGGEAQACP